MPTRPFNALARQFGRQLRDGRWVLPKSMVNKVHEQVLDGERHVDQLGESGLEQLGDFLEQKRRTRR